MDPIALTSVMPTTAVRVSTAEPTTAVLTRALRDGDEAAWRDFHTAYSPRLLRYMLVVCRGQEDIAREALQQTFLRAVRHMRAFTAEDELWSWLTVLARCAAADLGRRERRYLGFLARWFRQQPAPEPGPPDAERHLERLLAAELASLPAPERELLERKYLHGAAVQELAGELRASEKAVESRLTRARQHLKTAILAPSKMDPMIDHRRLLEEVLVAPDTSADPVAPILGAVRARRRQRRLAPLACAAAVAVLACVWLTAPWPGSSRETDSASQANVAVVVKKTVVVRVRSKPLSAAERASTDFASGLVRFHTQPDDTLRASDGELLAMVGGRGVGLFRINGRTELLFAADAVRSASE